MGQMLFKALWIILECKEDKVPAPWGLHISRVTDLSAVMRNQAGLKGGRVQWGGGATLDSQGRLHRGGCI